MKTKEQCVEWLKHQGWYQAYVKEYEICDSEEAELGIPPSQDTFRVERLQGRHPRALRPIETFWEEHRVDKFIMGAFSFEETIEGSDVWHTRNETFMQFVCQRD